MAAARTAPAIIATARAEIFMFVHEKAAERTGREKAKSAQWSRWEPAFARVPVRRGVGSAPSIRRPLKREGGSYETSLSESLTLIYELFCPFHLPFPSPRHSPLSSTLPFLHAALRAAAFNSCMQLRGHRFRYVLLLLVLIATASYGWRFSKASVVAYTYRKPTNSTQYIPQQCQGILCSCSKLQAQQPLIRQCRFEWTDSDYYITHIYDLLIVTVTHTRDEAFILNSSYIFSALRIATTR